MAQRLSYDAFGQRRQALDWTPGIPGVSELDSIRAITNRGYTDHAMVDDLNLIHMNGRVYDPEVGRFISADPFVPNPFSTQGFNRYAYVDNNPLAFMDPSGFVLNCTHGSDGTLRCSTSIRLDTLGGMPREFLQFLTGNGQSETRSDRIGENGRGVGNGGRQIELNQQLRKDIKDDMSGEEVAESVAEALEQAGYKCDLAGKISTAKDIAELTKSIVRTILQVGMSDIRTAT